MAVMVGPSAAARAVYGELCGMNGNRSSARFLAAGRVGVQHYPGKSKHGCSEILARFPKQKLTDGGFWGQQH